ncbi:MAG: PIN domain-containing protein [Acidobacteria bacterium]|nr:PIN domain-containing protein [Acidobacteriota bacterium]
MIAVDTNILIYAHRADSPWHRQAERKLRELAEGGQRWAIPWPCLHEFLAIVTHPRVFQPPSTLAQALAQVDAWTASPGFEALAERQGYWARLRETLAKTQTVGPRVHDARVFTLCAESGVRELWSADRDFNRFRGVRIVNPVV